MVTHSPNISLIVSTYNWPEALNLCLQSILKQAVLPDEVIIADDGSAKETSQLIETYQQKFPVPLIHVWQEDDGFQLSKIRNKAIAKASKAYIIQIDGDLILEKHFIQDHLKFRKPGTFVSGSRIQMSSQLSAKLISRQVANVSIFTRGTANFANGLRIPLMSNFLAERYKASDLAYVRGCNMAFWKTDLVTVNGYNEAILGWGREDSELALRLINSGLKKRIFKFGAVAFHIYHTETLRPNLAKNDAILRSALKNHTIISGVGLSQYF